MLGAQGFVPEKALIELGLAVDRHPTPTPTVTPTMTKTTAMLQNGNVFNSGPSSIRNGRNDVRNTRPLNARV
jgi:hypothetical protein